MINIKLIEWFDDHFYKIQLDEEKDGQILTNTFYLPSVTTKLQAAPRPFLARWRGDVGNREADLQMFDGANKGSRIHYAALKVYLAGGAVIYNPIQHPNFTPAAIAEIAAKVGREVFILQNQDEIWQIEKFRRWMNIVQPEILGIEDIVYDLIHKEAGTRDLFLKIKAGEYAISGMKPVVLPEGYYIADLKSGKQVNDEAYWQTADYAKMSEVGGIKIAGTLIIHTNAKTKSGFTTHIRLGEQLEDDYQTFRHVAAVWENQNRDLQPDLLEFPNIITKAEL